MYRQSVAAERLCGSRVLGCLVLCGRSHDYTHSDPL